MFTTSSDDLVTIELQLYNSLTRCKEIFKPINDNEIKMYSCGPTVYNYSHIGNLRAFIFSDLIHRTLRYLGYQVKLIMNITDVDDKTIRYAQREHKSLKEFTQFYQEAFFSDIKALGIAPAYHYPKATEHIDEMIEMIKELEKGGHTYVADGSVYFRLSSFSEYGKLSNIEPEMLKTVQYRIASDEYEKEDISDFVLWKKHISADGAAFWQSPWGKGRPGWHLECSAMSKKTLGKHFDIHTGGIDNRFPHHENEIAQSQCANHSKYVNYWLHCSHLMVEHQKMSKSLNNFYTLKDLLAKGYHPRTIRYQLIISHYRNELNFTLEGLRNAEKALMKVDRVIEEIAHKLELKQKNIEDFLNNYEDKNPKDLTSSKDLALFYDKFNLCLLDDLNVSGSQGALFELIHYYNAHKESLTNSDLKSIFYFFKKVDQVFNVFHWELKSTNEMPIDIKQLIEKRNVAKANKDWVKADEIREQIQQLGYKIMDCLDGTKIEKL